MPEVRITVGGRDYEVACQEGEEHFLHAAAKMLDAEARVLLDQIGRLPEGRLMLMSGLMLADKSAGVEDQLREAQARIESLSREVEVLKARPAPEPVRLEVPVIPDAVTETMAEIAARAEALAARLDDTASGRA